MTATSQIAGKYLAFTLGDAEYAVDAMQVVGIITPQDITPMPQAPSYVKGLTNVRGKVVPVISARGKLGLEEIEPTGTTCIIMVMVGTTQTGVMVDSVCEVLDIEESQVEQAPGAFEGDDLLGLAKMGKRLVSIVDLEKAFSFTNR